MSRKTEADYIYLLLSIIEHTEGKVDWDEVAKTTGLYKSGKFARQAFNTIKGKYSGTDAQGTILNRDEGNTPRKPASKKRGRTDTSNTRPAKKSKKSVKQEISGDESSQDSGIEQEEVEI